MEKKYIPYKFPTSLFGWRERWFYVENHHPSLPKRTAGALRIQGEWTMACHDMSQIKELLKMIKKHRDAGVTGVSSDVHVAGQTDPASAEAHALWLRIPWCLRSVLVFYKAY
jgi:hypothetical protein